MNPTLVLVLLGFFSTIVFCQTCASFSISHNVTRLNTTIDDGFVDAGDRLLYCTTISRTSAATSVAYNLTITDDLRVVNYRSNNVVTPTSPGFTSTFTPAPVPTMDLDATDVNPGDYFVWLPRGVFTGPQVLSDENNVCYIIGDGGVSALELGHENATFNRTAPLNVNTIGDVLRRIKLSTGEIVTVGWAQGLQTPDGTTDIEAIVLNATEPTNFRLFATDAGDLGWFQFNKSQSTFINLPSLTGNLNLFQPLITASGTLGYYRRASTFPAGVPPQSFGGTAGVFPTSTYVTDTAYDVDGLTIFPYFPYELWGANRDATNLDPFFKFNSTAIERAFVTGSRTADPYIAQFVFGRGGGGGTASVSGAEVYTRIINDLENTNVGSTAGRKGNIVFLPQIREGNHPTKDVDDMAFDGAIPPDLYVIANAGADPGALLRVQYYDGAYVENGPHPVKAACGTDPVACPNSQQFRIDYPGWTVIQGAFGTADFEGMSFSPDGRLHLTTGKDGEPCVGYSTNRAECPPGQIGCECIYPAIVGGLGTCNAGAICVATGADMQEQNLYGYCLPASPTTVLTAGSRGGPCLGGTVNVSADPTAYTARCSPPAGQSQATALANGVLPRCINWGSTPGAQAYGLRCMLPQNCRSTDNYLWQVDPRTGQLKEQSNGNIFLLDQFPTGATGLDYGDYEGVACQTEKPVRDFGPPSITWCYTVRVRDTVPAARTRFGSQSSSGLSSHVILQWKCTPTDPNPPSTTEDHPPPVFIRPNPPPTVTFNSSDDDCTSDSSAPPAVQIGEIFVMQIVQRLIEGTTYDARFGVLLPANVAHVTASSTVVRRGCGNHLPAMSPAASTVTIGANQYAVFAFGDYVNPFNQACSPNPNSNPAFTAGDEVVIQIALRPQYNPAASQWTRGQRITLTPVLIYDVYDPNVATNANPNSMFRLDANDFVLSGTSFDVIVVEPTLATVRSAALQSSPAVPQTVFNDGDKLRVCTTISHDPNSNACAHDPATNVTFGGMFPTNCILAGSLTPIEMRSVSTAAQCTGGTKCDGKLLLGETIVACQNVTIQCPTPTPPPTPQPSPSPPTPPPSPQCFPLALQWETNRNPGFPDERIYSFNDPSCVTILPPVKIGNYVWLDQNHDGLQTAGEPPISGVTVRLFRTGMQIGTTTTGADGLYFFSSSTSPQLVANCAGCFSMTFTLPASGLCGGVQCSTLTLTDVVGGAANDASNSDAVLVMGANTIQFATTLDFGSFNDVFDVGFEPPLAGSSIGDLVWYDENGDGLQNGLPLEPGIPNVPVDLYDGGSFIARAVTDANGLYSFTNTQGLLNLKTGWRILIDTTVPQLARLALSPSNVGANDAIDSDATPSGTTAISNIPITPADGTTNTTYDFGFAPLRIGNYVWRDTDSNGLQGAKATEPQYVSASLTLVETLTGVQVGAAIVTDNNGEYYFRSGPLVGPASIAGYNITPGVQYTVVLNLGTIAPAMPRVQPTIAFSAAPGATVNTDSNGIGFPLAPPTFSPATTSRANVTAPPLGQSDLSIDFGLSPCFVLGDRVWKDANRNGIQDAGEMDFTTTNDNVRVRLLTEDSVQIATSTLAPAYSFSSCDYQLQRTTRYRLSVLAPTLAGQKWSASPTDRGTNDALDSDGIPIAGDESVILTNTSRIVNNVDNDNDFGFQPPAGATIGDFVWDDINANGLQDIGEPGIGGVVVTLRSSGGGIVATCTTDANGIYKFDEMSGLTPMTQYSITIDLMQTVPTIGQLQSQYSPSQEFVGTDVTKDSNGVWTFTRLAFPAAGYATSSVSYSFTSPASGQTNNTYDFGFHKRIDIGDLLWYDGANPDGLQQAAEIPSGTFAVGTSDQVTVFLDSPTSSVSTLASRTGQYLFMRRDFPTFIFPGVQYRVRVLVPAATSGPNDPLLNYQPTLNDQVNNNNDLIDSDGVLNAPQRTAAITPAFPGPALGSENLSLDFGFVQLFRIGDYIWFDNNVDGLQTPEAAATFGLANVTVDLWQTNGMAPFTSTVSTTNGYYEFNSRANPGMTVNTNYVVSVPICAPNINCDNRNPVLRKHPTDAASAVSAAIPLMPTLPRQGGNVNLDSDGTFEKYSMSLPSSPRSFAPATTGTYGSFVNTYDFGFIEPLVIGDLVWVDSNGNGRQDEGPVGMTTTGPQPGISGVVVRLYLGASATGTPLATCTTGSDGKYYFSSHLVDLVLNTQYTVAIDTTQTALANFAISPSKAAGGVTGDSDGALTGVNSQVTLTSPAAGQPRIDLQWDFGFIPKSPTVSIGDFVWIDTNRDGIQNNGEPGVGGVQVVLNDFANTMMTTTNSSGYYLFQSPATGPANLVRPNTAYRIEINIATGPLANYQLTRKNAAGSTTDNDSNGVHVTETLVADTNVVTGSLGSSDLSHDFGFIPVFYIGDRVWSDNNGDGLQTPGEPGIGGVNLALRGGALTIPRTDATNTTGFYLFPSRAPGCVSSAMVDCTLENLQPGTSYTITIRETEVIGATEYRLTLKDAQANSMDAADSDFQLNGPGTGTGTSTFDHTFQATGNTDLTRDAGFIPELKIGDQVWVDLNGDGLQQLGAPNNEPGIPNVNVELMSLTNVSLAVTKTNTNGVYFFSSLNTSALAVGTRYYIRIDIMQPALSGYVPTTSKVSGPGASMTDSDGFVSGGYSVAAVPPEPAYGVFDTQFDFGFTTPLSIGDFVWIDTDGDGIQGSSERGLGGVTLQLRDSTGAVVASVVTASDGSYRFTGVLLPFTTYNVSINQNLPPLANAYQSSPAFQGTDRAADSNGLYSAPFITATVTTGALGSSNITIDFGLTPQFNIGDFIWLDSTNSTGLPQSPDGCQQASETGISGVNVELYLQGGTTRLAVTTSNSSGYYFFNSLTHNLKAFTAYRLSVPLRPQNRNGALASYQATRTKATCQNPTDNFDNDGTPTTSGANIDSVVTVTTGQYGTNILTVDFGFTAELAIGDFVWNDCNGNGIQDDAVAGCVNGTGIEGVRVFLAIPGQAPFAQAVTNNVGQYQFKSATVQLLASTPYRLYIQQSDVPQYKPTQALQGTNRAADSNAVLSTDGSLIQIDFVSPPLGQGDLTLDFGLVKDLLIGDFVWIDSNANGRQDAGEPGLQNVQIDIVETANPSVIVDTFNTIANGTYFFSQGLQEKFPYLLRIQPDQASVIGYQLTVPNAAVATDATDSDATFVNGQYQIAVTSPAFGVRDTTFDFGLVPRIVLGLVVWRDQDADGIRETGEPRMPSITLELRNSSGIAICSAITNSNGTYTFDSGPNRCPALVPNQQFTIVLLLPTGFQSAPVNAGADDTIDSDGSYDTATNTMRASVTPTNYGYVNLTIDFGLVPEFRIGDFVWDDLNGDGRQSAIDDPVQEPGHSGVVVQLWASTAQGQRSGTNPLATTTTLPDGSYLFASSKFPTLQPSTRYVIQITTPNNYYASPADQGADDSTDSDAYPFTGSQQRINMTSPIYGVSDLTNDFGIVPACGIAGVVWEDSNGNGQRGAMEPFLPATVTLRDSPNNLGQRDPDQSIAVGANGAFLFDCQQYSIEPGKEYILIVNRTRDLPNHKETTPNTPPDTTDSDGIPDRMNPGLVTITITSPPYGTTSRNNDFGFLPVIRIGDKVWQDLNSEQPGQPGYGVQSASLNDQGIAGVPVLLLSSTGTLLFQTTTNSLGIYQISSFDYDIVPGTQYFVAVPLNDAKITGPMLTAVAANQGGNPALDSNGVVDVASQRSRASVTIANYGVTDLTIDFGFVPPPPMGITIGNFVWNDDNNNGRQDPDEPGVEGVTVRLCTTAACTTVVGSTTTSAGGYYLFTNQGAGSVPFVPNTDYVISVDPNQTPLLGTRVGKANALAGDDDNDSDGVLSATTMRVEIPINSGPDGRIDVSFDFAFIRLEVGDYVWEDLNGNGIQESNETPLSGVTVELRDATANTVIATTVTTAAGIYIFSTQSPRRHNIIENTDYKITISVTQSPVAGYVPTLRDAGSDDTKDSDAYLGTTTQARIDYNSAMYGTVDRTRDFGLVKLLEIGDYVFNDNNNNGIQDGGDTPRANMNVELWDSAGQTRLAQTTTNSTGYYLFSALRNDVKPNTPYLVVLPAADVTQLVPAPLAGTTDTALDSNGVYDATKQWIQAPVTTGQLGTRDLTIDFGLMPLIEIGDFVWRDTNADGLQTAAEPGINGVTLVLRRQSDNVEVDRTTTAADPKAPFADGYYLFTNRRTTQIRTSTQYYIVFDSNPVGLQLTKTVSGSPSTDSNGAYNGGGLPQAAVTTPSSASSDRTIDFGFVPIIRIGQIIFNDRLGEGCRDASDPGIEGIVVQLYRRDGANTLTPIAQTTTNNLGFYEFNSLTTPAIVEGVDYVVSIATSNAPIANNAVTQPDVGGACPDTRDSDCRKGATGFEINVKTTGYVDRLDNDCGFVKPFLIGDFVFNDVNGDGLQSSGEPGIPNVVVRITRDGQTTDLLTTTTDNNGLYSFSNVNPADSSLQLTQTTAYTIRVDLSQDPLLKFRLTTPNVNGNNQDTIDSDFSNSGSMMGQVEASLTSPQYGTNDLTWDLGLKPAVFLGDRVWDDLNGNGVQDPMEPGIPGVLVQLFCNGVKIVEQRTINDGFYGFYNADPDTDCRICVPLQDTGLSTGYEPVAATAGADRATDSNGIVDPGRTLSCGSFRTGGLGSTDTTIDFGFARGLVLGDFVWKDLDGEGDQDSDEPGIANVVVELYKRTDDPSDPSTPPLASTRTDANGKYVFASGNGVVTPNTLYNIVISLSKNAGVIGNNFLPTIALSSGADDTVPSDSNGVLNTLKTHVVALASAGTPGVSKLYYDFGFVPVTCIGDYVWNDDNGNGRQDSNENGNGNVAVAVYRTNADGTRGALVCEVRSAQSTGLYSICTNMPACAGLVPSPNPYEVTTRLSDTPSRRCTFPDVADNAFDDTDNDGRKRGGECVATVIIDRPGIRNLTIDFGLVPNLLIGDRVFRDSNADGLDGTLQNRETELGLQFVQLTLNQGLNLIDTTTTNQFGKYLFGDGLFPLRPNTDYVIRINASQTSLNGVVVTKNVANQPEIDSNGRLTPDKLFVESPARTGNYGTNDLTIDFGFRVQDPINIGQYVWIDRNNDGIRDASERVVRGVEVRLYDPTDKVNPVAATTTDNLGRYVFNSKRDGFEPLKRYDIVLFLYQAQLTNVTIGRYRQGSDSCRDSDSIYDYGLPDGSKGSKYVGESHLIQITTPDYGIDALCNDFALFDCVESDPGGIDNFAGVRFTGEASIDFKNSGAFYQQYNDSLQGAPEVFPDVGVPRQFPTGTLSGWDIRAIYAAFSPTKDQMLFGIDCFGICGDADGNGDPGAIWTGLPSGSSQYKDERDLGGSETFVMLMDLNSDGKHDITMGVSSIVSNNYYNVPNSLINCPGPLCGWRVYSYVQDSSVDYGSRFGLVLPQFPVELYCNPSRACPDLEWKVSNWTAMPGLLPQPYSWSVLFEVFAGSFVDGGIGEDRVPNENMPARFTFDCWKISKEDLQFPNNRQRPISGTDLTGVCMSHNCCNYDHGAGCSNAVIQTQVCAIDNYCCSVVWDKKCVGLAGQNPSGSCDGYLPGPTGPPAGASCAPTSAPVADDCCIVDLSRKGCSRADITSCVAAQPGGAFCNIQWDQSCVNKIATCPNPLLKTKCAPATTSSNGGFVPTPSPGATPAPTPAPVCVTGQLSCDCFSSNTCNTGQGICDLATRKCVKQTCNLGTAGCQCRAGNVCDAPYTCSAYGDCVSNTCTAGGLSCQCRADGTCNAPLICKANNCVLDSCQQGDLGCTCRTGNACNLNYVCISGVCSIAPPTCPEGTFNCPCKATAIDQCAAGLVCNQARNLCQAAITPAPTPQPTPFPTPAPPGQTVAPTPMPTPVGFTPARTPAPTPGDPNTSCISGAAGCVCSSDGTCLTAALACVNDRCQASDPNACQEGTAGCRCAAGDKCTTAKASCNADKICVLPSSGKEPSMCAKPTDIDNDGVKDCDDQDVTLGVPKDGQPAPPTQTIDVYDPTKNTGDPVGTVVVPPGGDGMARTVLTGTDDKGQPTTSNTITVLGGSVDVPNPRGGTVNVPYVDVSAGSIKKLDPGTFVMICVRRRPAAFAIGELMLASRPDSKSTSWEPVDMHVLIGALDTYCGYTSHFTQFAIIPKTGQSFGTNPKNPALALNANGNGASNAGGLEAWMIAVIVIAAVICCLLLVVLIVCLLRRRGGGRPVQQRRRAAADDDGANETTPMKTYDDKSVTNPAFSRDSDTPAKPPTLRGGTLGKSSGGGTMRQDTELVARPGTIGRGEARPGTLTRAAVVEDLSDTSLSSLSDDRQPARAKGKPAPRESSTALDMDAYQTMRKDVVDEERGNSIIDMSTYKTLTGNESKAAGNDRSAIDAAIFSALESDSE